ncbi:PilZ domain-containing protein [Methylobacterium sp. P1-11]|uniref:PilZ domain-containing protein n=1 Tax=Methylobacterium sp. P1-11 TaxID=2024616 RepID=UPI0011EE29D0|nr:PilZ domain-containing protein [Methylobacterium sp. P1-11]KAA0122133.1 PilZ domain-containing protein [Methylobacterium sp. P1-11]
MPRERRARPRSEADLTGRIVPNFGRPIGCKILDRSASGAQLRVNSVFGFPETFMLEIPQTEERINARVVWRSAGNLGVELEEPARLAR